MISNTDSTLLVYSAEHIRVKVYKARERNGQQNVRRRLDALIVRTVPDVRKAVKVELALL